MGLVTPGSRSPIRPMRPIVSKPGRRDWPGAVDRAAVDPPAVLDPDPWRAPVIKPRYPSPTAKLNLLGVSTLGVSNSYGAGPRNRFRDSELGAMNAPWPRNARTERPPSGDSPIKDFSAHDLRMWHDSGIVIK